MRPHLEVLASDQLAALENMAAPLTREGFYLAGGTAVALHLGHRRSVDLDWFTESRVEDPLGLVGRLKDEGVLVDQPRTDRGTVHGLVGGVRVSLIEFRYPLLASPEPLQGAHIAALEDLAPMKLAAIAQRGTRRDFVDVHALAHEFRPLPDLLDLYRRKFGVEDLTHVVYGLGYFDDAEPEQMPAMLRETDWEAVKADFRRWIRAL